MNSRFTRRQFMVGAIAAGAALTVPWYFDTGTASAFYKSQSLRLFAQPLRSVGPGGIPVAAPDAFVAPVTGAIHYSFNIAQFTDQLHTDLGLTALWGYNPAVALGGGSQPQKHLGGIIVAQRGVPIQLTFTNTLPSKHILPVDISANFTDAQKRQNATSTHLHGGLVPWISDGGPFSWFTPGGQYGPSVKSVAGNIYKLLNPNLKPGQAEYYYPNNQSARLVWYHDHAHDITRLNAYAGIASAYIIRDTFEANLRNLGLPDFVENGGREIPIVIQDKIFVGSDILTKDPTWSGPTGVGSLWYPHTYEADRWELGDHPLGLPPDPSIIPEMFGDTMLANGTVWPEATVEARRYRLRVLNACQARFLNLQLYMDDGSPAERWDLLVDFSKFAGQRVILYNDAPAPFPGGDPDNDYFPSSPNPTPGLGPNTRQILRFKVVPATSKDPPLNITTSTDLSPDLMPFLVPPGTAVQSGVLHLPPGVPMRQLTLNETFDGYGRLIQVLGRQPFNEDTYTGTPSYTGPARGPDKTEIGWKETVRMNPGEVTTVIMKFDLPAAPPHVTVPASPRTGGNEYVWHCHILEHEEHDMMRSLIVT